MEQAFEQPVMAAAVTSDPPRVTLEPLPRSSILVHPAVVILLTVIFTRLIKSIGNDNIVSILSPLHLNTVHRSTLSRQKALKKELFATKQQLGQTSSQDEFAKWAKLRRKVDKLLAELETVNSSLSSSKTTLSFLVKGLLFVATTIFPFFLTSYYRKTPVFWLPPAPESTSGSSGWKGSGAAGEWLGPLGWLLSLPSAPRGSVSATVWAQVCGRVIAMLISFVGDFIAALSPPKTQQGGPQELIFAQPSPLLRAVWYGIGLFSCSYAFKQFDELEKLAGISLSEQYGGHYQFLTNLGLCATYGTLIISLTHSLAPWLPFVQRFRTVATVITLPVETLISLLYWTVLSIDPSLLIPEKSVSDPAHPGQFIKQVVRLPLLTDLSMHAFPAILLLVDYFAFSPPFPTPKSSSPVWYLLKSWPVHLSFVSTISYCLWVEVCASHNGHYPYPLLSILSTLHRSALYVACSATMVVVLAVTNRLHKAMDSALNRQWEGMRGEDVSAGSGIKVQLKQGGQEEKASSKREL